MPRFKVFFNTSVVVGNTDDLAQDSFSKIYENESEEETLKWIIGDLFDVVIKSDEGRYYRSSTVTDFKITELEELQND